jgi:hypothetical protein
MWCCRKFGASVASTRWLGSVLAVTAALLAINYAGVELWPSALIATLQPARAVPFAQFATFLALAGVVHEFWCRRDFASAIIVMLAPLAPSGGLVLLLAAALLPSAPCVRTDWRHGVLALGIALAFCTHRRFDQSVYWSVMCLLALLVPIWLTRRLALMITATVASIALAVVCAIASNSPRWPYLFALRFAVDAPFFDAVSILARRFAIYAPADAIVLVPPMGETESFKIYARRPIVVDDKHFPFTSGGIAEWKRRMDDVLGTPLVRGLDGERAWATESPARLATVAARYGAHYVLTKDEWHPALPGRQVEHGYGWSLWELSASAEKNAAAIP